MFGKARSVRFRKCTFGMTVITAAMGLVLLSLRVPVNYVMTQQETRDRRLLEDNMGSSKWIVTSHLDANDVINIHGWILLLYENTENPNCRWPNCLVLDDVIAHDSRLASMGKTSRKLSAYLYAISRGAKHICCVEEWHYNIEEILTRFSDQTTGMILTNISKQEPKTKMASPDSLYSQAIPSNYFYQNSTIQRFVIDNDIKPSIQFPVHFRGDLDLPVYVPAGRVISLSGNVVVFRYDAFWALAMRDFGKVSSHLIQKILWVLGYTVGIHPVDNFDFTIQNYKIVIDKYIDNVKCDYGYSTYQCIEHFLQVGRRYRLIRKYPAELVHTYLKTLVNMGYYFPERKPSNLSVVQTVGAFKASAVDTFPQNTSAQRVIQIVCPKVTLSPSLNPIKDIGLIVTFNTASLYRNIPGIEAMYRPYFKHIIYCGPNITHFELTVGSYRMARYMFIEAFKLQWYYMYECTTEAMQLNLNVKGFLQIGDDTIVNPWVIRDFPRHSFWLHDGLRVKNIKSEVMWAFWESGRTIFRQLISDMRNGDIRNEMTVKNLPKPFQEKFSQFYEYVYVRL